MALSVLGARYFKNVATDTLEQNYWNRHRYTNDAVKLDNYACIEHYMLFIC